MSFTVVVCTYNRAELLSRLLDSLVAAEAPSGGWRLLVVLNACSDHTETMLRQAHTTLPNMEWIHEPTPGKSHALNRAVSVVRAPAMAFVDDDHRAPADFLVQIEHALQRHPQAGMICGRIEPDWDGSEPEWVHERGPFPILPRPVPKFYAGEQERAIAPEETLPGGGNLVVRQRVFEKVGGFDPRLGPSGHNLGGAEDGEFLRRALAAGEELVYVPAILQYHAVIKAHLRLPYLMRKSFQRSRAVVRIRPRENGGIPPYVLRKCLAYAFQSLTSVTSEDRRRYYLVRLAAALGELRGMLEAPRSMPPWG